MTTTTIPHWFSRGALALALLAGCAGTDHVSTLANTPPRRGAYGPFAATFVSHPRGDASADALRGEFERDRRDRAARAGWMGDYLVADAARAGVVTLWANAATARAQRGAPWMTALARRFGGALAVEHFDVPVWIDNAAPAPVDAQRVVVFVSLPLPWFHPRGVVESRILARVPEYQRLAGLERKYFVLMEPARVGGIYVWRDRAAAAGFYDAAWHAGVRERYGADAQMRTLDLLATALPEG